MKYTFLLDLESYSHIQKLRKRKRQKQLKVGVLYFYYHLYLKTNNISFITNYNCHKSLFSNPISFAQEILSKFYSNAVDNRRKKCGD